MRRAAAFSFRSPFTLAEIFEILNASGPWQWRNRDNDSWGGYLSAGVLSKPDLGIVKIIQDETAYVFNIQLTFESSDANEAAVRFSTIRDIVLNTIFPGIKADQIEDTDTVER